MLYAQQSNQHSVMAYDLKAKAEVDRLELPVKEGVTEDDWDFEAPHHGLAMSPDGQTLCIAGRASDYVGLVATSRPAELAQAELERGIRTGDADLGRLVAAIGDTLTEPAARKLTLLATVPAGDAPGWSEITEDGRYCIVTNTRSDDISIVSIADRAEAARMKAGRAPKHITMAQVPVSILQQVSKPAE
jgi:hypothetical protein